MGIPFLQKLGQKMVIVKGFSKKFSELLDSNYSYYCQLNLLTYLIGNQQRNQSGCDLGANLGQIRQCCDKSKEAGNINKSFSYFT